MRHRVPRPRIHTQRASNSDDTSPPPVEPTIVQQYELEGSPPQNIIGVGIRGNSLAIIASSNNTTTASTTATSVSPTCSRVRRFETGATGDSSASRLTQQPCGSSQTTSTSIPKPQKVLPSTSTMRTNASAETQDKAEDISPTVSLARDIVDRVALLITEMKDASPQSQIDVNSINDVEVLRAQLSESRRTNKLLSIHFDLMELQRKLELAERWKSDELKSVQLLVREELFAEIIQLLDAEFGCSVCNEVFISPSVTKCGHTFCELCLATWTKDKINCPICRAAIYHEWSKHVEMESFINRLYLRLSPEIRNCREKLVEERDKASEKFKRESGGSWGSASHQTLHAIRALQREGIRRANLANYMNRTTRSYMNSYGLNPNSQLINVGTPVVVSSSSGGISNSASASTTARLMVPLTEISRAGGVSLGTPRYIHQPGRSIPASLQPFINMTRLNNNGISSTTSTTATAVSAAPSNRTPTSLQESARLTTMSLQRLQAAMGSGVQSSEALSSSNNRLFEELRLGPIRSEPTAGALGSTAAAEVNVASTSVSSAPVGDSAALPPPTLTELEASLAQLEREYNNQLDPDSPPSSHSINREVGLSELITGPPSAASLHPRRRCSLEEQRCVWREALGLACTHDNTSTTNNTISTVSPILSGSGTAEAENAVRSIRSIFSILDEPPAPRMPITATATPIVPVASSIMEGMARSGSSQMRLLSSPSTTGEAGAAGPSTSGASNSNPTTPMSPSTINPPASSSILQAFGRRNKRPRPAAKKVTFRYGRVNLEDISSSSDDDLSRPASKFPTINDLRALRVRSGLENCPRKRCLLSGIDADNETEDNGEQQAVGHIADSPESPDSPPILSGPPCVRRNFRRNASQVIDLDSGEDTPEITNERDIEVITVKRKRPKSQVSPGATDTGSGANSSSSSVPKVTLSVPVDDAGNFATGDNAIASTSSSASATPTPAGSSSPGGICVKRKRSGKSLALIRRTLAIKDEVIDDDSEDEEMNPPEEEREENQSDENSD